MANRHCALSNLHQEFTHVMHVSDMHVNHMWFNFLDNTARNPPEHITNAVDVFKPEGFLPIPTTDIQLVGVDDNSIDKFNTPDQTPMCDTADPSKLHHLIDFEDAPCNVAGLRDWHNDGINDVGTPVDTTSAMFTCTRQKQTIHSCTLHLKLCPCPICLKAALDTNKSVVPEGRRLLQCCSIDGQGCRHAHVCHQGS